MFVEAGKGRQRSRLARAGYSELDMPYIEDAGPPQEQGAGGAVPPECTIQLGPDVTSTLKLRGLPWCAAGEGAADTWGCKITHRS